MGLLTITRISPVEGSMAITLPTLPFISLSANSCKGASIVVVIAVPAMGALS